MKKVIWISTALILLAVIAAAVFLLTLDVDRYRPFIISRIESAIGKPVTLEKIGLSWQEGLALKIQGLAVYPRKGAPQPLFSLKSAYAAVNAGALLSRQLQVGDVILKSPEIRLVRRPDGTIEGLEEKASVPGQTQPAELDKGETTAAAVISFLVRSLELREGLLIFRDEMENPPAEWQLDQVDVTLKDIGWGRPSPLEVRAAFVSGAQNLELDAMLVLPGPAKPAFLKDVRFATDLAQIDAGRLPGLTGEQRQQLQQLRLAGKISASAAEIPLEPRAVKDARAVIRIAEGRIMPPDAPPVEQIEMKANVEAARLSIESLSALFAGGEIGASGAVVNLDAVPRADFQLTAARMDLAQMIKARSGEPYPSGRATLLLKAGGTGNTGRALLASLQGEGKLALSEITIHNLNILREVFNSLSAIPGLVRRLQERLPPDYQEKLQANETRLAPTDIPFQITNGLIAANPIRLSTEDFQLVGAATIGLDGSVSAQTMLLIEPLLSDAFIRSVEELRYLANNQGALQIPIKIQGRLPEVRVIPDLQYVASRLAVSKAAEVIGGFLKPKEGQGGQTVPDQTVPVNQASGPDTQASAPPRPMSKEEKVFSLIGQFLEASSSSGQSSQQSSQ